MILTHSKIIAAVLQGKIQIEPYSKEFVGPASYDLHLGSSFRRFKNPDYTIPITEDSSAEDLTEAVEVPKGESLVIKPSETILGVTQEKITLAPNIAGWLEGRSRFARIGLTVHISSGFVQPGVSNYQVLEITNSSPNCLGLSPGLRFCQIIFEECKGQARYQGQYQDQTKP